MSIERNLEREIGSGLDRSLKRSEKRSPGPLARLGTERRLRRLLESNPEYVRATIEELALMRAGWQRISYRRALRQIIRGMEADRP